ncbi:lytic transglycosylase domain-containing protein [Streptomyces sp. NBC_01353]|uniref:lytic transglycosylase domain-containing protein n=1 Tax=Streptomyces sp. NBC_01353 TaxID=2903835 RepID=UPI002E323103|nr:lytic transglycosylase domain-containing protein [Streptomyces sp. NBC_01353]
MATAVAATAMAALTGSQAPGLAARTADAQAGTAPDAETSGDAYYLTELPPLVVHNPGPSVMRSVFVADLGALPATVFAAYQRAEAALSGSIPGCALRWQLLAAIGQVESGQARGGRVDVDGTTYAPIIGPQLNGQGFALIRDTDGGGYDGDPSYDHAVGPMQFIPSTWARWGADGNGDGRVDPHNVHDAALAAGHYLCAGGRDLSRRQDLDRAILSYNHSREYLRVVLSWYGYFRDGHRVVPDLSGSGFGTDSGTGTTKGSFPGTARAETPDPGPRARASPSEPAPSSAPKSTPQPTPTPTRKPSATPAPSPKPLPSLVTSPGPGAVLPGDGVLPDAGTLPGNG